MKATLKELVQHYTHGTTPVADNFSCTREELSVTLRDEINELVGDYNKYRRNKLDVFEILQEAYDERLPKRVLSIMGGFAEVRTYKKGQKVQFKVKKGRSRAKKFVTKAALSGVYETFRLDTDTFTMETFAIGGGAYIDFERYLRGEEDLAESMEVLLEGFDDYIYKAIESALINATSSLPAANMVSASGWVPSYMVKLLNTARAYGDGAIIYATPQFIAEMGADILIAPTTSGTPVVAGADVEAIHNTGLIKIFRGAPVVELPNSYLDDDNTSLAINPAYAYVFPTGGEKPVKVGMEGDLIIKDRENRDNSMEIQAYKSLGVAIVSYNNWCMYHNLGLDSYDTDADAS